MRTLFRSGTFFFGCLFLRLVNAAEPTTSDFHRVFGELWHHVAHLQHHEQLEPLIKKRREEIAEIKQHWKEKLDQQPPSPFIDEVETLLKEGSLTRSTTGRGCAYLLTDKSGNYAFIIKPFDEEILCLNNAKGFASPYHDEIFRVRQSIPLYRSMLAEVLAYKFADILDLSHFIPETHLGIIEHKAFFDLSEHFPNETSLQERPAREKLCSIQRYLNGVNDLHSYVLSWLDQHWSEQDILNSLSQESMEDLFLLIWLLYDTDAHSGNIAASEGENGTIDLYKFDNGLTFPDHNERLLNALRFFPHAHYPLSNRLKDSILNLPVTQLLNAMHEMEMEDACPAFVERVTVLKALIEDPSRTLADVDLHMRALALPQGADIASLNINLKDLEEWISTVRAP